MYRIILITLFSSVIGLSGCATTGENVGDAPSIHNHGAGPNAAQSAAQNIAPVTSYVNTHF